uniref:Uncharacterized protein n=1 Tax=Meloidogyne enterolobii TaxID=390850 RepID=A0A6V7U053_MELEN|nr:unnamed protein product [Meloidogyne enterolobii]
MLKIKNIFLKLFLTVYLLKELKGQIFIQTNNANKYFPQNEQSPQVFTLNSLTIRNEKIIIEGNIKTFLPFEHKLFINPIMKGCEQQPNSHFHPFYLVNTNVKLTYFLNSNEDLINYRKGINICIEVKFKENSIKRLLLNSIARYKGTHRQKDSMFRNRISAIPAIHQSNN